MDMDKVKSLVAKTSGTLARLYDYLRSTRKKDPNYVSQPSHSPSVIGSPCSRKIYYSYFKVPEDSIVDAKNIGTMEAGNKMEEMVMEWLKAVKEHIPYVNKDGTTRKDRRTGKDDFQFHVSSKKWRIRKGKIDNVARDTEGLWIYEIKSLNDRKFKLLKKGPIGQHLIQNAIYIQCFNDLYLAGEFDHIPEIAGKGKAIGIKLLYINRNDSELKIFTFKIAEITQLIFDIDRKIGRENNNIDNLILPPKTPDMCNYCNFKSKCDMNWNGVQKPVDIKKEDDKL